MPLNQELTPTTITVNTLGHPDLHTQERTLIEEIREVVNQSIHVRDVTGAVVIDWEAGPVKDWRLTGNASLSVSTTNVGAAGQPITVTLRLRQDATGGRVVTWSGVRWPGGAAPSLTTGAGREDWLVFTSLNNGTTWTGALALKDVR